MRERVGIKIYPTNLGKSLISARLLL
jgi:hypothetical protein